MTFQDWLLEQCDRQDPVGDMAHDCKADPAFPRTGDLDDVDLYMALHGSDGARRSMKRAIREWRRAGR